MDKVFVHGLVAVGEGAVRDHVDGGFETRIGLVVLLRIVAFGVEGVHLVDGHAEEEEVLSADALTDFDVGTVEGADGHGAVESELHVAGTGGFLAGLGDLLVEVGCRDEVLCETHVVVPREVDVQLALDIRVVVDDAGDVVDQLDGLLGEVVARSGLGAEHDGARHDIVGGDPAGLDVGVACDHGEDLQCLTLVFVQTLDHGVDHGVRVDVEAVFALGVVGEVNLVGLLDGGELLDEFVIGCERFEALEQFEVAHPLVGAEAFGDEVGQTRVGELDEAARGHAVGHVGELVRIHVGEVLQGDVLEQLGVQLGNAVDVGAAVGGQVGHAHGVAGVDGHVLDGGFVDALGLELGCELVLDLLDDFEVTRQEFADELGRPHFQGFRKQGVAGVVEGLVGDGPGGVPIVAVLVHEDAHELRNADDRVGVVELEGDLVREGGQIRLVLTRVEDADGVVDGGGHEEVLLLETQCLALRGGIFRIQDLGDVLSFNLRLDGVKVLGLVEGEQVELVVALGGPQTQGVHTTGSIARNHVVDRHRTHGPSRLPYLLAIFLNDFAAEGNLLVAVVIDVSPRLFIGQPVVRGFDLLAVFIELLLEDAVLVLNAITECRHAQRGERIDEAGGQTAEATVAEARLVLGVDDVLHGEAEFLDRGVELLGQTGVEQRVAQLLAHQEFCGQVADCLGVAVDHVGLGLEPGIHEVAAHCGGRGDVHVGRLGLLDGDALGVLQLLADLVCELLRGDRGLRCGNFSH